MILWSYLISSIGNSSNRLLLASVIFHFTKSESALTASFLIFILPPVLLGNWIGRFGERFFVEKFMMFLEAVGAILFLLLGIFYQETNLMIVSIVFFISSAIVNAQKAAIGKYISAVEKEATNINKLISIRMQIIYISLAIGPYLAGLLIEKAGVEWGLFMNACSFFISWILIRFTTSEVAMKTVKKSGFSGGIWENFSIVKENSQLYLVSFFYGVRSIAYGIVNSTVPVIVLHRLGGGEKVLSYYFVVLVIGSLMGTFFYRIIEESSVADKIWKYNRGFVFFSFFEAIFLFFHLSSGEVFGFILFVFFSNIFMLIVETEIDVVYIENVKQDEKLLIGSFQQFVKFSGFLLGTLLSTLLVSWTSTLYISSIVGLLFLLSMIPYLFQKKLCYESEA
ncbi:MAG: MFS transporter [Bdellovibrionota bacterium]